MRPTPRPPFRWQDALALAIIFLGLVILVLELWTIHRVVFQAMALAALLLAFRYCAPVAAWVGRMPLVHRAVFLLLIAGVVAGHFSLQTHKYFPFVAWGIFSADSEKSPVLCRELIGTTREGKSVRLLVEQLFPSIVQFDLPADDKPREMDDLVHAMAKVYNGRHPADPLRQVDLMLMAVELEPPAHESRAQPSCELLQRYDISSAQ